MVCTRLSSNSRVAYPGVALALAIPSCSPNISNIVSMAAKTAAPTQIQSISLCFTIALSHIVAVVRDQHLPGHARPSLQLIDKGAAVLFQADFVILFHTAVVHALAFEIQP